MDQATCLVSLWFSALGADCRTADILQTLASRHTTLPPSGEGGWRLLAREERTDGFNSDCRNLLVLHAS